MVARSYISLSAGSYQYWCFQRELCEHPEAPQFLCKSRDKVFMEFRGSRSNILEEIAKKMAAQSLHCNVIQNSTETKGMKMLSEKAKNSSCLGS